MRFFSLSTTLVTAGLLCGCFGPGEMIDLNQPDTAPALDGGLPGDFVTIAIDTSLSGASLSAPLMGFPILIRLDASNFDFAQADVSGEGVAFVNAKGDVLPHEIEMWDASQGSAVVWVLMDTIQPGNQTIRMYLGSPGGSDVLAAFPLSEGFAGVFHLGEQGNNLVGGYPDSSDNRTDATGTNMNASSQTEGLVGFGRRLDGSSYITIPTLFGEPASVTVSCWFQTDDPGGDLISIGDSVIIRMDEKTSELVGMFHDRDTWPEVRTSLSDTSAPHFAAYTVDVASKTQSLYVDGKKAATSSYSGDIAYTVGYTESSIGVHANRDRFFVTGLVDEVRIENEARSEEWLRLCYENQRPDGASFIQIE